MNAGSKTVINDDTGKVWCQAVFGMGRDEQTRSTGEGFGQYKALHTSLGIRAHNGTFVRELRLGSTTMTVRVWEQLLRYGIGGYGGESDQFSAVAGQQRV